MLSEAMKEYRRLEHDLLEQRRRMGGRESAEEEQILDRMDIVGYQLTAKEVELLRDMRELDVR